MNTATKHGLATYLMVGIVALDIILGAIGMYNDAIGDSQFIVPAVLINFAAAVLAAGKYVQAALSAENRG